MCSKRKSVPVRDVTYNVDKNVIKSGHCVHTMAKLLLFLSFDYAKAIQWFGNFMMPILVALAVKLSLIIFLATRMTTYKI